MQMYLNKISSQSDSQSWHLSNATLTIRSRKWTRFGNSNSEVGFFKKYSDNHLPPLPMHGFGIVCFKRYLQVTGYISFLTWMFSSLGNVFPSPRVSWKNGGRQCSARTSITTWAGIFGHQILTAFWLSWPISFWQSGFLCQRDFGGDSTVAPVPHLLQMTS